MFVFLLVQEGKGVLHGNASVVMLLCVVSHDNNKNFVSVLPPDSVMLNDVKNVRLSQKKKPNQHIL